MGLAANDIKRVIAYSTLNSLGLMFVALGSGSVTAAMLYLFVHAFFKALLFLASGSVIHATEKQEITELGGLAPKMPVTARGVRDRHAGDDRRRAAVGLLGEGRSAARRRLITEHLVVYIIATVERVITALYMTRLFILTFLFEAVTAHVHEHAHDAEPLDDGAADVCWRILAAVGGFVVFDGVGEALGFPGGFGEFVYFHESRRRSTSTWDVAIISTVLAGGGMAPAGISGRTGPSRRGVRARHSGRFTGRWPTATTSMTSTSSSSTRSCWRWAMSSPGSTATSSTTPASTARPGLAAFAGFGMKFLETGKLPNYALAIVGGVIVIGGVAAGVEGVAWATYFWRCSRYPLLSALVFMLIPSRYPQLVRYVALVSAGVQFVLSVIVFFAYEYEGGNGLRFDFRWDWLENVGFLGENGITLHLASTASPRQWCCSTASSLRGGVLPGRSSTRTRTSSSCSSCS